MLIQDLSTFAADSATPFLMMAGNTMPTWLSGSGASGRDCSSSTICRTTSATASGVAGRGVGIRKRSPTS